MTDRSAEEINIKYREHLIHSSLAQMMLWVSNYPIEHKYIAHDQELFRNALESYAAQQVAEAKREDARIAGAQVAKFSERAKAAFDKKDFKIGIAWEGWMHAAITVKQAIESTIKTPGDPGIPRDHG